MTIQDWLNDEMTTTSMSRRRLLGIAGQTAVAGLAVGLLAACGDDDDESDSADPTEVETNPTSEASGGDAETPSTDEGEDEAEPTAAEGDEPAASGEGVQGGELIYGTLGIITFGSLDMTTTTGTFDLEVGRNLNEPYIWLIPEDGTFVPGLAESWEVSDDSLSYTFKLREDVTFHDGTTLDAEAAKFNFDRMTNRETNPNGLSYSYLGVGTSFSETVVVDPFTFQINLTQPNAIFLYRMRRKYVSPQSPTAVQEHGDEYFRNPVGCGPFKFVEWVEGDHVTFEANEDYAWAPPELFQNTGRPYLDRLTVRLFDDLSTKAIALESGEVDYAARLNAEDIDRFQSNDEFEVLIRNQQGQATLLEVNVERAPTDDPAVREALGWAMDREGIVNSIYFGLLEPATHMFTPDMFSYDESLNELFGYDLDKAAQILEDAGWVLDGDVRVKDGEELRLIWIIADTASEVAQLVQADLASIGIAAELQILAGAGLVEAELRGDHNISGGSDEGWVQEDPDVVRNWAHSTLIDVRQNGIRVRDPELDALLDSGIAFIGDPRSDERKAIYEQIQREIMENYYVIPLYYRKGLEAHHPRVKFSQPGFTEFDPYGSYHEWADVWIEE
jgi:peptide/nickel transport system substrate-binding protein